MSTFVDTRPVSEFVQSSLCSPPGEVLEVGAGRGDLALRLINTGYDVTAIDPSGSNDGLVRPVALSEFNVSRGFDAVVASRTLHHIENLQAAINKLHRFTSVGGIVILHDFGWERVDVPTGRWLHSIIRQRSRRNSEAPLEASFPDWFAQWRSEHAHLHRSTEMLDALREKFNERCYAECPYLAAEYVDVNPDLVEAEVSNIEDGAIKAAGFRFVGERLERV